MEANQLYEKAWHGSRVRPLAHTYVRIRIGSYILQYKITNLNSNSTNPRSPYCVMRFIVGYPLCICAITRLYSPLDGLPLPQHLVGKVAVHPFCDRKLPVVADDFVEREFGTGES